MRANDSPALHVNIGNAAQAGRSEEHTSELQSPRSTLFPYTTLFRSSLTWLLAAEASSSGPQCEPTTAPLFMSTSVMLRRLVDRKSTRLNSSHPDLHSFPTRRSSDLL